MYIESNKQFIVKIVKYYFTQKQVKKVQEEPVVVFSQLHWFILFR